MCKARDSRGVVTNASAGGTPPQRPLLRASRELSARCHWTLVLAASIAVLGCQQACNGEPTSLVPGGLRTLYVDMANPAASDDNPGSEDLPWATLYKAAASVEAGDVVYVKAGTYEAVGNCSWSRPALNPENSGTADHPIAFRAYPGHRVIVTNSVADHGCPPIGANGRDFIIWDGFEVAVPGSKGIVVFHSTGSVIENCVIHGIRGPGGDNTDGIRIEDSADIIVRNSVIYDIRNAVMNANATGIKLYHNERVLIENNEIYDVVAGLRNKMGGRDNVFRYNWIHDCSGYAIQLRLIQNGQAYGNIVSRCEQAVTVSGSDSRPTTQPRVFNNTFVDANRAVGVRDTGVNGAEVWNNIFFRTDDDLLDSNPALAFCGFNLVWPSERRCGSSNLATDPLFVDYAFDSPDDFKLGSGSQAQAAGRNGENLGAYARGDEVIGPKR